MRCHAPRGLHALVFAGLLALAASSAGATDYKIGPLTVADAWARATPKGVTVGAGYMKITNNGAAPDRLIAGSADVSDDLELHETRMTDGVMRMRPVKGGVEIKPGETVAFDPGAFHVMFVGLKKPLAKGDHVTATLVFEKAGPLTVDFDVLAVGATRPLR